jgi:predicted metal-dependent hydrolase
MTSLSISQDEINNILWKACDTFRGTVDPAEYKNYILVMLFVKYISDVWRDHYDAYQQQYKGDAERVRRRMEKERFRLPEGSSFTDLYAQRNAANLVELINIALEKIEDANRAKLQGVFRERLRACHARLARFGIPYPALNIRKMNSSWGSCSAQGALSLNIKLIQAPVEYIDYVLVHELCHMKYLHHGPEFIRLLTRALPDWQTKRDQLNRFDFG